MLIEDLWISLLRHPRLQLLTIVLSKDELLNIIEKYPAIGKHEHDAMTITLSQVLEVHNAEMVQSITAGALVDMTRVAAQSYTR